MKKYLKVLMIGVSLLATSSVASAQYYQIANQLGNMISPALSGSLNYKGYIEGSYTAGLGSVKTDLVGVSTSQGFKYRSWFFMGVGLGVDVAMSHVRTENYNTPYQTTSTGVMIPVFTDFRFNIGNQSHSSFFADVKLGASFLMGNKYLQVGDGYLTSRQYFYLKPSLGVRIPIGNSGKSAVDVGITYQLLTSNYWYLGNNSTTLNNLGATVGFEW